jgi:uncharacterized membrane protein YagU involved in acid resistance
MKNNNIRTILTAGIIAAILDITGAIIVYAVILNVTTAQKLLQSVAAGALGKSAREGGWSTALIGLALHTFIAVCFAAFYFLIRPYWKKIFANKWISGIVYGCLVWCIMNIIVLPMATGNPFQFKLNQFFFYGIGLIIFMVGIPISLITEKYKRAYI